MDGPPPPRTCVVFDLETQQLISGSFGTSRSEQISNLQVSVGCALVIPSDAIDDKLLSAQQVIDRSRSIEVWRDQSPDASGPFGELFACLDAAEVIVAYNGIGFDLPVLFKYISHRENARRRFGEWMAKTHDPFLRLRSATGVWASLDKMLAANGLPTKTSSGVEAVQMWEQQQRDKLLAYCKCDVEMLTRLVLLPGLRMRMPNGESAPMHLVSVRSALESTRACLPPREYCKVPATRQEDGSGHEQECETLFVFESEQTAPLALG
jgi:hypothetical protein